MSYAEDLEGKGMSPPGSDDGMTLPGTGISDLYEVRRLGAPPLALPPGGHLA